MKRLILLLICLQTATALSAKDRVIQNPAYEFTTSGIYSISRIEVGKTELRLHVQTKFIPHWWVKFTKENCLIEDSETGRRWPVTSIRNAEFDKELTMPDSGDTTVILIFPLPDKTVTKINYFDEDNGDKTAIYGISLNPKTKRQPPTTVPPSVNAWIESETSKAKRLTMMDFSRDEFFSKDSARLIGYINGYDPRAGFTTGMVYAGNEITRESFPVVVEIHEDGRFEGVIPMNYPVNAYLAFQRYIVNFYIEPGQTLSLVLDWDEFLTADRKRNTHHTFANIKFSGASADINKELTAFKTKLPDIPYVQVYNQIDKKNPVEFKKFYEELFADYTSAYKRLLETEPLSERTKNFLQNDFKLIYISYLFEYEMRYKDNHENEKLPEDFYDFMQDIDMNDKHLLISNSFSMVINRLEYCSPFWTGRIAAAMKDFKIENPGTSFYEYITEELGIKETEEDSLYYAITYAQQIKVDFYGLPALTEDGKEQDLSEDIKERAEAYKNKYTKYFADYHEKYMLNIVKITEAEKILHRWELIDSIYQYELKFKPGILYDIIKVREMDNNFGQTMKRDKNDARYFLTQQLSHIENAFLKSEAERIFQKNFPAEKPVAYTLADTKEAKIFKEIIAPFQGKILFVDFWATTCGPCVYNIKQSKSLRERYKDSPDVEFIFITSDNESPLNNYNTFIAEQNLTHTYRLSADDYRYLRQLFKFNGIPHYVLIDREGRVLNDNASSFQFEYNLKEILSTEK